MVRLLNDILPFITLVMVQMTYRMEFLPFHYLLTTIGEFGELRYVLFQLPTGQLVLSDISTSRLAWSLLHTERRKDLVP